MVNALNENWDKHMLLIMIYMVISGRSIDIYFRGHAAELVELLDWYRGYFFHKAADEDNEASVDFNGEVLRAVNKCVVHLGKAFAQTVATHRRYHGLSTAQKSRHMTNYEAFLAYRRKSVGVDVEKLCLMPGDPGFVLWASAKQSFQTGVSAAVGLQFEGEQLDKYHSVGRRRQAHSLSYIDTAHTASTQSLI
ncbi:hypothetical protein BO83DRAFT_391379 [Aspergillus eucalypticola CBS 122712]|uniref:Uncharacterized protein n=1 Tax=Aspergillus eucalypticola (strain CBS 122712 / IBT 29274) TaxID=1448314 RepID=A0A317UXX9_ASPEC|nr:uncharacterized protein BO83DRAFT_391379 [Aspergillus eucalypticola CBS 122712]PWY66904.1 hypothetical protein BO83DRAFT_391379 [Aspergillus eucalypticola CBS 122712]